MRTLAFLLSAGAATFMCVATAVAEGPGSCKIPEAISKLLRPNAVVKDLHDQLDKIDEAKLKDLRVGNRFYPAESNPERDTLIKRFEGAIKDNRNAFELFLADLVSAREEACENCRWVDQWNLVKNAGYANVTPVQLRWITAPYYESIKSNLTQLAQCDRLFPEGEDREKCRRDYTDIIESRLGELRNQYPPKDGYEGGAAFAARLAAVSRKRHCGKKTDELLGP